MLLIPGPTSATACELNILSRRYDIDINPLADFGFKRSLISFLPTLTCSCRPTGWQLYVSYIAPFVLIYTFNFVMFLVIIINLIRKQRKLSAETGNANLGVKTKAQVVLAVSLSLLFGIGWGIGVPATQSLPVAWLRFCFQLAFVVLVGFQGLFIFIMYGIRVRNVRLTWMKWFYIIIRDRNKVLSITYGLGSDGAPSKSSKAISSTSNQYTLGTFDSGAADVDLSSYAHITSNFNQSPNSPSPIPSPVSCISSLPIPDKSTDNTLSPSAQSPQPSLPKPRMTKMLSIIPTSQSPPHTGNQNIDDSSDKSNMLSEDYQENGSTVSSEADNISYKLVFINENTD